LKKIHCEVCVCVCVTNIHTIHAALLTGKMALKSSYRNRNLILYQKETSKLECALKSNLFHFSSADQQSNSSDDSSIADVSVAAGDITGPYSYLITTESHVCSSYRGADTVLWPVTMQVAGCGSVIQQKSYSLGVSQDEGDSPVVGMQPTASWSLPISQEQTVTVKPHQFKLSPSISNLNDYMFCFFLSFLFISNIAAHKALTKNIVNFSKFYWQWKNMESVDLYPVIL
jgi:hypothetical protein